MKMMLFLLLFSIPLFARAEILEGIAKNSKGEIVYLEKHKIDIDSAGFHQLIRVEYMKPDGEIFATMTSDFSKSKTMPATNFEDFRFKTKLNLLLDENSVYFEEVRDNKTVSKKSFPLNASMVASQGFENFLKMNLSKLENDSVNFKFGVLESKDFYSLEGYKKSTQEDEVEYGIRSSSWLINLFAGEISVVYDSKTKKLKSFSGRSNILDDSGKAQDVLIDYKWKSEP